MKQSNRRDHQNREASEMSPSISKKKLRNFASHYLSMKGRTILFFPFGGKHTWTDRAIKQYPLHAVPIPIDKSHNSLLSCRKKDKD